MLPVSAWRKYQWFTGLPLTAPASKMNSAKRRPAATSTNDTRPKSPPVMCQ